jgi:acetyltransferase-like isoleucine patch superfamily enzyme
VTGALGALRRRETTLIRALDRARRAWLLGRLRALALWKRSTLDLDVAADLRVGRRITVKVAPSTHVKVRIAPRCRIGDDVFLFLVNGSLVWGEGVQLRMRSTINLVGDLSCEGDNIFSYGNIIHCAESIRFAPLTQCAEYVTVADSAHFFTEPDVCVSENTVTSPIDIGKNVFLAPRVSVGRGVTIGDFCLVGPNSVVVQDVASGSFVSGVPAKVVRALDLPWQRVDAPST